jgi:DNA-binding response OmpR family regulator
MKRTILVIDDELSIRMLLENFLSDEYNVVSHVNGSEALTWLKEGNQADLLLVDLDMPLLNGYDFTENIRKINGMSNIPVIILSAKQKSSDRIRSYSVGADDFIQKPFNPEELMVRIQAVFRRHKVA